MNKDMLGRRIIDLIEENKIHVNENEEVLEVEIDKIKPNPNQPRASFDSQALKQLADSINQHGVIQPIILKPAPNGYMLVAGERRVRASVLAGKKTVPAIIRDYNAIYLTELSILENLQREDLTPIEEAVAYERAIKNLGLTQAELGKKIGKSRSYITNMIGLLNLPVEIIEHVNSGDISMGHARVLSKLDDIIHVKELANKIINDRLSVRKIEDLARKKKLKTTKNTSSLDLEYVNKLEQVVRSLFSDRLDDKAKVHIKNHEIRIKFKNWTHLINNLELKDGDE